ncbi:septal ring lytic transglycosylase RlpA family protein [Granulicella paludicola]|uniref:septal ring lytic transglycosylase RlpA family protein n=1 Tax=Granulicella paludicola TaxID=474951 RepID=UPI0021DFF0D0|nr:septal ring lytic transglycosylase RlpA family protein [Granulicella paludicola]
MKTGLSNTRSLAAKAIMNAAASAAFVLLTGCHHRPKQTAYQAPPVFVPRRITPDRPSPSRPADNSASLGNPASAQSTAPPGFYDDISGKPVLTETGNASWYGPNYHHHAAADGSTFDQNELTAAHRTLPLGTTVRVTNLTNGQQVLVRITDRGPFAPDRILDLSKGAADAIGGVRAGIIKVKVEAFAHVSTDPLGRWAVQTGAFKTEQDALDLKSALIDRYPGSRVSEFQGPTGFWVRIDPATHERKQAEVMLDWIGKPDPSALPYLVRID